MLLKFELMDKRVKNFIKKVKRKKSEKRARADAV